MAYRDELLLLLCKAENIGATLDIEDIIWEVKPRLQRSFWQAVRDRIEAGLQREQLGIQWAVGIAPHLDPLKEPKKNDAGYRCTL
jgi:hypothetical protein